MSTLVTEPELLASTGYSQRGRLETWLRAQGIRYWRGRDGQILTTTGLMEAAALGQHAGRTPATLAPSPITFAPHAQAKKSA
jgi:hypothetical protein